MRTPPKRIAESGVIGEPIDFKWGNPLAHIGPIEGTALHDAVHLLTHCAAVALGAALEDWAAWRFSGFVDTQHFLAQADGVRAWGVDPRYYKGPSSLDYLKEPPAASAMSVLADLAVNSTDKGFLQFPSRPPDPQVHEAYLLRYVTPKKGRKAFESWLKAVLERLALLAPRPEKPIGDFKTFESREAYFVAQRPYRGVPLPPEALDLDFDYKPDMREELLDRFLRGLDWKDSEFLRTPDEMKALGFEGEPYRLSSR